MVDQAIHDVIQGRCDYRGFEQGQPLNGTAPSQIVFPGSFNPLHEGHTGMAECIRRLQNTPVDFELSVANVDKDTISSDEVKQRLRQFSATRIWITRAATFVEKAELFPGRNFIIGADTAIRLLDQKYYTSTHALKHSFARIEELECQFLVFGRKVTAFFQSADSLSIPVRHQHLFTPISEQDFRLDISSRELRSKDTE